MRLQECSRRMSILLLSEMLPKFRLGNTEVGKAKEDTSSVDCVFGNILIVITDSCRGEKFASDKVFFRIRTDSFN